MDRLPAHLLCSTRLGGGETDAEHGIGAELLLVGAAVGLVQEVVDGRLVLDVEVGLDQRRAQGVVDVGHGLEDALAAPLRLVLVPQLVGLMLSWHRSVSLGDCCHRRPRGLPVDAPEGTMAR